MMIIKLLFILLLFSYIFNKIYFKEKVGIIVLSRDNYVETTICIPSLIRYIRKDRIKELRSDGDKFLKLLKSGEEYISFTHAFVIRELEARIGKENVKKEVIKPRYTFVSNIFIGNFKGCFTKKYYEKKPYYRVSFIMP